ncbi:MAG: hypothetical protein KF712_05640 [Akkermansiaceae bacterium]|nr:hypothetical protein [Akkermansiaceae bacterium]
MTARLVHAVLAAGVHNPKLISHWREDPTLLAKQGIDPESMDLDALWKFSGLTIKVRHNGTRPDLPSTYRLMSFLGVEIELFASYATWCAENHRSFANTALERERDLIGYMEGWLDFESVEHCLLWDLIRHEYALASLRKFDPEVQHFSGSGSTFSVSAVPSVFGNIILCQFRYNPQEIVEVVKSARPSFIALKAAVRQFCYWRPDKAKSIKIVELDEFGYYLLSFVDGECSLADLGKKLGCGSELGDNFFKSIGQLCELGILILKPNPEVVS